MERERDKDRGIERNMERDTERDLSAWRADGARSSLTTPYA